MTDLLRFERPLWKVGLLRIAGVDEVGMGPLAGPVVAAAVILPAGLKIAGVRDSKTLDPAERESMAEAIRKHSVSVGIGVADVEEIDSLNIYHAGLLAMSRAVTQLPIAPQYLLADARSVPGIPWPQRGIIRGDARSQSIAAASILAKVYRDRLMERYDLLFPEYGFARHKGYPTPEHQRALADHGACSIHRRSFNSVEEFSGKSSQEFYRLKKALAEVNGVKQCKALQQELFDALPRLSAMETKKLKLLYRRVRDRVVDPSERQSTTKTQRHQEKQV